MGKLERGAGLRSLSAIANSGSSEAGSFAYDEDTLRSLIKKWLELADHYEGSLKRVNLGEVKPPGLDFASERHAKAANSSGKAYMAYLAQNYEYSIQQAQLLQNTLDDYLGVEHHSVADFNKTEVEETGPQAGI
ncbi:hypothetical protein [Actinophytocola sp.]|uniref:hypothetical protein n=1 Tax=Actinophytocola sp. TaxID=1872138 RepID=UPI002ED574C4